MLIGQVRMLQTIIGQVRTSEMYSMQASVLSHIRWLSPIGFLLSDSRHLPSGERGEDELSRDDGQHDGVHELGERARTSAEQSALLVQLQLAAPEDAQYDISSKLPGHVTSLRHFIQLYYFMTLIRNFDIYVDKPVLFIQPHSHMSPC